MFQFHEIAAGNLPTLGLLDVGAGNNRDAIKYNPILGNYDLQLQLFDADDVSKVFEEPIPRTEVILTPAVLADGQPTSLNITRMPQRSGSWKPGVRITT